MSVKRIADFLIKAVSGFFYSHLGKLTSGIEKNPDKEPLAATLCSQRWARNSIR
jgi:hypothetical protein